MRSYLDRIVFLFWVASFLWDPERIISFVNGKSTPVGFEFLSSLGLKIMY